MVVSDPPTQFTELSSRKTDGQVVPTLTVLEGPEIGAFFAFDMGKRAHQVGRAETADIRLPDSSVSRVHAICVVSSRGEHLGVRISDNQSTNGVMVNGKIVDECSLISGDKVRLGDVLMRFEWMAEEEIRYHTDVSVQIRRAEQDHLTGLLSRGFLEGRLPRLLDEADRRNHPVTAMLLDLDHFKRVNDVHGHLVGDAVVQRVGQGLLSTLRESDFAVRYGGEEMLVLMLGTGIDEATVVADRVREMVAELPLADLAAGLEVTASIGLACRRRGEEVLAWIERSDQALYSAKAGGRNQVVVAEDAPEPPAEEMSVDTDVVDPPELLDTERLLATAPASSEDKGGG
ncbi:MAG: GGDEF domain-containing protein [Myxococcota bacterium]|nr:GGDEF domain-containing protein [Myxococcota bacterium]